MVNMPAYAKTCRHWTSHPVYHPSPTALLFHTFDHLLLLESSGKPSGKPVYFGGIGPGVTVMTDYFESHGARHCHNEENPAEWLIDVTGAIVGSNNTTDWSETWRNSGQKKQVKNHLADVKEELSALPMKQDGKERQEYAVTLITQLWAVTVRNFEQDWGTLSYLHLKIPPSTGTVDCPIPPAAPPSPQETNFRQAFFIGFSFLMLPSSIQGVQNKIFSFFLLMTIFSNRTQLIMEKFVPSRTLFEAHERPVKI